MRVARALILLIVSGAVAGCYKPSIGDMLKCADGGVHLCPEGFQCERSSGFCRRNPDGGGGGRGGTGGGGGGGSGGGQVDAGPDGCLDAGRSVCDSSDAGLCDPFCQTGCGDSCRKKCSLNTAQVLTCNDVMVPTVVKKVMETCTIFSEGLSNQTDDCGAGLVCLEDGCRRRCYQFCREDADCTNAGCSRPLSGGLKVCDVPFVDGCVPLGGNANMGCSGTTESCYISSSHPTRTICDCPFMAGGEQSPCTRSRDCNRGLVCAFTPVDGSICLRVCRLSNNGSDCPSMTPGSCRPYPGNPPGSMTHATFGFCF